MNREVVVVGAGGMGRELRDWWLAWADAEAAAGRTWTFLGFLDDGQPDTARLERIGARFLGPTSLIQGMSGVVYYVAVGDSRTRRRICSQLESLGARPGPPVVHPSAVVGSDVTMGEGTVVCPNATVSTNSRLGAHVQVNYASTIGHDSTLEDFVTISPGANVSGSVHLEAGVFVGTNASVNQGLVVGSGTVIGAGAAVVTDLPENALAVGVPARVRDASPAA